MSGIRMEQRIPLLAIIKGLRESGEIGDKAIACIAEQLRAATKITDDWGHRDTSDGLRALAESIEKGKVA